MKLLGGLRELLRRFYPGQEVSIGCNDEVVHTAPVGAQTNIFSFDSYAVGKTTDCSLFSVV